QDFDYNTFSWYTTSIDIEPMISKAIHYVTTGETPVVYYVTGSDEPPLTEALTKVFYTSNYELREVNLTRDELPEDCDMLVIAMPGRDWSADKKDRIQTYLQNDGKALVLFGYSEERFGNMDDVLSAYGIKVGDYIVVEGDAGYYYMGNPAMLVPRFMEHEITEELIGRFASLQYIAAPILETGLKKNSTQIDYFIRTSNSSYGKSGGSETINKEEDDVSGPFYLAAAIVDSYYTDVMHYTRIVAFGGGVSLMDALINDRSNGGNWDLLIKSADWLQGQQTSIFIPSKSVPSNPRLQITQGEANTIALFSVIILPLAIIGTGLFVWLRRRHS
ncbi:MAG: GldG family protein, partial [Defluviitaleaceae bacterium]|nr:GldG family protein [Defluviitaleaceae bacterium]